MKKLSLSIFIYMIVNINIYPVIVDPGAFVNIGLSRPSGMGDAFTAVADDVNAIFYNPAGIYQSAYKDITFMYTKQKNLIPYNYAGFIYPFDKYRGAGMGLIVSGDDYLDEKTILLSYCENFEWLLKFLRISTGLNFKIHFASFGNNKSYLHEKVTGGAWGIGADLGFLWAITDNFQVGIFLRDAFSYISWESKYLSYQNSYNEGVPLTSSIGICYKIKEFIASCDISDLNKLKLGLEKTIFTYIDLRAGFTQTLDIESYKEYNIGIGIGHFEFGSKKEFSSSLDIAYLFERLASTLKIQTSFKFK